METQDESNSGCNWSARHDEEEHSKFIDQIPGKPSLKEMQKIVLTGTAHM